MLLATLVAAAVLTSRAYDARPAHAARWAWLVAAVLVAGAVLSGGMPTSHRGGRHPLVRPFLTGVLLFAVFVVLGWVARLLPFVHHGVVAAQHRSHRPGMLAASVAGAIAEELFYRGALFERVRLPVLTATFAHVLVTLGTGNVALVLAAATLGVVFGLSRRASGGWWAPAVSHVTWTVLTIVWLPR